MNRRQFIKGAATAVAATILLPGEQERYLLRTLGPPKQVLGLNAHFQALAADGYITEARVFTGSKVYDACPRKFEFYPVNEGDQIRFLVNSGEFDIEVEPA